MGDTVKMLSVMSGLLGLLATVSGNIVVYTQNPPHLIEEEFRDMPASFGPDLPFDGLRGLLVMGIPADGCGNLTAPPVVENFTDKWIVLLARFNCSFETKVRNAMAAGYSCAIIHNVGSRDLETMSVTNPDGIDIPSVFVSNDTGKQLGELYTYNQGYYIMVNGDLPFNINTHLLLPFAVVVVLCLLIILIFMIVKCIKDRRRARRHRLPNRSLKQIPTCKFSKGDPYDTCAICLDDYQEGERLRVLPCAHAYHAKCVDPWLTENRRVCPVCKRRVLTAGERRPRADSDSDDSDASEPLLDSAGHAQGEGGAGGARGGGTFEPQSENPFLRAARLPRFMARLRGAVPRADPEVATPTEENQPGPDQVTEDTRTSESAALIQPSASATAVGERRSRRSRRRRARSASTAPAPAPAAAPAPASAGHSINGETNEHGEIGVAALPVQPTLPPNLINL